VRRLAGNCPRRDANLCPKGDGGLCPRTGEKPGMDTDKSIEPPTS